MGNFEEFLDLGSKIIQCSEKKCDGVVNRKEMGIIPRVIILSTLDGEVSKEGKAKLGVFGINPGPNLPFENLYYKEIISKFEEKCAFFEIHNTWVSEFIKNYHRNILYCKYFTNTIHFIHEVSDCFTLNREDLILFGEIVYCQSEGEKSPPINTKLKCIEKFLNRVLEFITGDIILCLGKESYEIMKKIKEGGKLNGKKFPDIAKKLRNKKILGIYHPSGSRVFYQYFDGDDTIIKRKLNPIVYRKIKEFMENEEKYGFIKKSNSNWEIEP